MSIMDGLVRLWNRVLLRTLFESADRLLGEWSVPVSEWLVIRASRRLPPQVAEECQRQWLADLYGLPRWLQLRSAVSLLTSHAIASRPEPRTGPQSKGPQSAGHSVAIELPPHPLATDLPTYDVLTGLVNRRTITKRLNRTLARSYSRKRGLSVVLVDVDDFRSINRALGHLAGDALLKELSRRLRMAVRGRGIIGRFAGDRFAVLLPNTSSVMALEIAEHLRSACEFPLKANHDTFRISASLGVASIVPGLKADDLWSHAALAVGEAKQGGRNCVRRFGQPA